MKTHNFCALISTACLAACSVAPNSQLTINHTNDSTAVVNIENAPKYVLLPIQENKPEVQIMLNGTPMDVRLAVDSIDYTVPFPLHEGSRSRFARGEGLTGQRCSMEAHGTGRYFRHD